MLGMGRALGETIAVALVIGSNQKITSHLFQPGDSMASVIAHEFGEAASTPSTGPPSSASPCCCSRSPSSSTCWPVG